MVRKASIAQLEWSTKCMKTAHKRTSFAIQFRGDSVERARCKTLSTKLTRPRMRLSAMRSIHFWRRPASLVRNCRCLVPHTALCGTCRPTNPLSHRPFLWRLVACVCVNGQAIALLESAAALHKVCHMYGTVNLRPKLSLSLCIKTRGARKSFAEMRTELNCLVVFDCCGTFTLCLQLYIQLYMNTPHTQSHHFASVGNITIFSKLRLSDIPRRFVLCGNVSTRVNSLT